MRMWMVPTKFMCNQHLLGEHVEHHMLIGSIQKQKSLSGYIDNNCLEPLSIKKRHNELVDEMLKRNIKHNSPLPDYDIGYLTNAQLAHKIDSEKSLHDLINRCSGCKRKFLQEKYHEDCKRKKYKKHNKNERKTL